MVRKLFKAHHSSGAYIYIYICYVQKNTHDDSLFVFLNPIFWPWLTDNFIHG